MRQLTDRQDDDARLGLDVYTYRLATSLAAMTVALGGLDTVVFTGGVGERSADIRQRAATKVHYLGVSIDEAANAAAVPDVDISADGAQVATLVVAAREDLEIARAVEAALS
jgi:acetate kinase